MICKHCNKEVDTAIVISECHQKAVIQEDGTLTDYSNTTVGDTEEILCNLCLKDISEQVEET